MNAFRLWEEIQWISYLSLIGRLKKNNNMSARSESAVEQHTKNTGGVQGIIGGGLWMQMDTRCNRRCQEQFMVENNLKKEYAGGWEEIRRSCCFAGTVTL